MNDGISRWEGRDKGPVLTLVLSEQFGVGAGRDSDDGEEQCFGDSHGWKMRMRWWMRGKRKRRKMG